jgi:chemotaxis protein MotD
VADMQSATVGDIATDPAARGAAIQQAPANASAQSAAASPEPASPTEPKARTRGPAANAPVEKGSSNAMSDIHLATRADAARPAMKATVVHQATHFAPALGAANIQAISTALVEAAGDLRSGAERAAPDPAMQQPGARPTGPVKTLTIQLTPIALGKITVEMRMIGGAMKVDIQVADPKALELVRSDKDLIMNLLRKAGVVPDTVTVQTADNASSARQNPAGQGGGGSAFDREASRDGSDGSGRSAGPDEHDQGRMSHDDRSTDQSRLRGDIYL